MLTKAERGLIKRADWFGEEMNVRGVGIMSRLA